TFFESFNPKYLMSSEKLICDVFRASIIESRIGDEIARAMRVTSAFPPPPHTSMPISDDLCLSLYVSVREIP
ncbi:MAG: hypothetical protein QXP49_02085, partial [Nitrososphaerota archaeon]